MFNMQRQPFYVALSLVSNLTETILGNVRHYKIIGNEGGESKDSGGRKEIMMRNSSPSSEVSQSLESDSKRLESFLIAS